MKKLFLSALAAVSFGAAAFAQQGVTDSEILIGTHSALSGPLAPWGQASIGSAEAYFTAINSNGGIHGRQIVLVKEDHGYEVPRAAAAGEKLVIDDGVFAMFGALGTPHNNAVLPLQEEFGVPNVFPLSAARSMEGEIAFQGLSSYYEQIQKGTAYFVNNMGVTTPCIIYLETDFGRESLDALNDIAAELGLEVAATAAHQPRDTDFDGTLLRLQREGCDFIALGVNFPEAIAIKAGGAKIGYDVPMMGSTAIFEDAVILIANNQGILPALEGLYAAGAWISATDAARRSPAAAEFKAGWEMDTGAPVTGAAIIGRIGAEFLVAALENAGPDLTTESFIAAMETTSVENIFTGGTIEFGSGGRKGSSDVFLSRITAIPEGAHPVFSHIWLLAEEESL